MNLEGFFIYKKRPRLGSQAPHRGAALRQHQAAGAGAGGAELSPPVQELHDGDHPFVQSAFPAAVRPPQPLGLALREGRHDRTAARQGQTSPRGGRGGRRRTSPRPAPGCLRPLPPPAAEVSGELPAGLRDSALPRAPQADAGRPCRREPRGLRRRRAGRGLAARGGVWRRVACPGASGVSGAGFSGEWRTRGGA